MVHLGIIYLFWQTNGKIKGHSEILHSGIFQFIWFCYNTFQFTLNPPPPPPAPNGCRGDYTSVGQKKNLFIDLGIWITLFEVKVCWFVSLIANFCHFCFVFPIFRVFFHSLYLFIYLFIYLYLAFYFYLFLFIILGETRLPNAWLACGVIVLCSWARHFTLTVPLFTQEYKWVPAICRGNLKNCWGGGGLPAMD